MYESLHVAVKMYINYSFFYIYICCFYNVEVCNLCIVVGLLVILPIWKITWKRHYSYFKSKNCFYSNFHRLQFPRKKQCVPWNAALGLYPIAAAFRNSKHQVRSDRDLDLSRSRDVISHVTIWFSTGHMLQVLHVVGTYTRDFVILRLKCI